ncbi:MAG: PAS domain-containing protein, partial [Microcoleaceae cyanobacterium]
SAIASNLSLKKLSGSRELIQHTYQVIESLIKIREGVKDVERFRRGYLLTNNIAYLQAFDTNITKTHQALQDFRILTKDNSLQQEQVSELYDLINIRLYIWQKFLEELANTKKTDIPQVEAIEKETKISQEIINLLTTIEKTEYQLLKKERADVDLNVKNTTLFSNLVYGLGLLSMINIYWLLLQEISHRRYAQNLLDQTNSNLAELVHEKTAVLEKEQKRLVESQKIAHIGSFEYDITTDQITWSEEAYRIFQYDPHLPTPPNEEFMSHFHPEDLPHCVEVLQKVSERPLAFNVDYRFQCADGTLKYINSRGQSVIDEQGKMLALVGVVIDITAQKKIEVKLREQAERLKLIIEGTEMATWDWYLPTNQLIWSRRHYEILGLEYPGHELGDYHIWMSHLHPEDRQEVLENYDQSLKKGEVYQGEYRIIRSDNQAIKWLGAIGGCIEDETGKIIRSIGVLFDITERKEAEIALQNAYEKIAKNEQRYRSLIEATSQAVWQSDCDGYLLSPVTGWQKITGQSDQEMSGLGWLDAIHPDDIPKVQAEIARALQEEPHIYECEYRLYQKSTGDYGYFLAKSLPLFDAQGNLEEWIGTATNITATKLVEQLLRENNNFLESKVQERTQALEQEIAEREEIEKQMREMTIELERSNEELSQFAYIASHDLQEPLRAIVNFAQKISTNYQGRLDAKADMYIEFVVDGASRMQNLVRDLLSYSRVGRKDLTWQPVDINNLLIKVCHDLQVVIKETEAQINIPPLPLIYGDHSQLGLLWQNLLSNSLKYHSDRPVNIEILLVNDHFPPEPELILESYVLLAIKDNGIGIDSQYSDRIFGIFQRLHTSEEYPGTGLGLAICQKIVERHHGKIWVESVLGEGSTFYLVLPQAN